MMSQNDLVQLPKDFSEQAKHIRGPDKNVSDKNLRFSVVLKARN